MKFKAGDKIKCIVDGYSGLKMDNIYQVVSRAEMERYFDNMKPHLRKLYNDSLDQLLLNYVIIVDDHNTVEGWRSGFFILVEEVKSVIDWFAINKEIAGG